MIFVKVKTSQGCLGKNKGCEKAPDILINDAKEVKITQNNLEDTNKEIEKAEGDFFVGGDHSITYALFRAFSKKHKNNCLIIFDCHADCVNDFHPPSHEDFNRTLIEEGVLKPENLFIIGLRDVDKIEEEYIEEKSIKHVYWKDIKDNKEKLVKDILDFIKDTDVYLSIDIDVLSQDYAPGTGYIVEGGFSIDFLIDILKEIKPFVKKADLTEINPLKDKENITINSAKEILGVFK